MKLNYKDIIDRPIGINKNTLSVGDNLYSFDNTIESIIVMDSRIIVLLKYSNEKDIRNIFCVDHMCDLLWRIEDIRKVYPKLSHDPYVGITINDSMLIANQFYGQSYIVDPKNGRIVDKYCAPRRF